MLFGRRFTRALVARTGPVDSPKIIGIGEGDLPGADGRIAKKPRSGFQGEKGSDEYE